MKRLVRKGCLKGFEYRIYLVEMGFEDDSKKWYCGYVKIPKGHKFYGKHYDEIDIYCHGGITYAYEFPDCRGFYIGFDCNHYGDDYREENEKYVKNECQNIIMQLLEMEKGD